jgi:hypothetical protein
VRPEHKKWNFFYIAFFAITVFGVTFMFFRKNWQSIKIDVSLLDMSKTILPTEFICKEKTVHTEKWVYEPGRTVMLPNDYAKRSGYKFQSVLWSNDEGVIEFLLVDFENSATAKINYELLNPARIYNEYYNFTSSDVKYWEWENGLANEESTQCGSGNEIRCQEWFYRARYSSYYLYITLDGPICSQAFEEVVKAITSQFSAYLQQ